VNALGVGTSTVQHFCLWLVRRKESSDREDEVGE